jgi:hypothetical protein
MSTTVSQVPRSLAPKGRPKVAGGDSREAMEPPVILIKQIQSPARGDTDLATT